MTRKPWQTLRSGAGERTLRFLWLCFSSKVAGVLHKASGVSKKGRSKMLGKGRPPMSLMWVNAHPPCQAGGLVMAHLWEQPVSGGEVPRASRAQRALTPLTADGQTPALTRKSGALRSAGVLHAPPVRVVVVPSASALPSPFWRVSSRAERFRELCFGMRAMAPFALSIMPFMVWGPFARNSVIS